MYPEHDDVPHYLRHKQDGAAATAVSDRLTASAPPAILVVEDDLLVRELIAAILEHRGYQVYDARCGRDALAILARSTVDMLLIDISLPGMNGLAVAAAARRILPGVPVLFVTGHDDAARLSGVPADHILQKPFRDDVLADRVRRLMPERAVRQPSPSPSDTWLQRLRA